MDVVLISDGNRPGLLSQTLSTLTQNSRSVSSTHIHLELSQGRGVGETKNAGAENCKKTSQFVLFSDDDMYWLENWDVTLLNVMVRHSEITQLGAWSHPYNLITDVLTEIPPTYGTVNAAHGGGFIMRWEDWYKYGPFAANAKGPGQSEDWAFSQRIVGADGLVRCIQPFVALHCGITNCEGKPATGAEALRTLIENQIRDYNLEGVYYE